MNNKYKEGKTVSLFDFIKSDSFIGNRSQKSNLIPSMNKH